MKLKHHELDFWKAVFVRVAPKVKGTVAEEWADFAVVALRERYDRSEELPGVGPYRDARSHDQLGEDHAQDSKSD